MRILAGRAFFDAARDTGPANLAGNARKDFCIVRWHDAAHQAWSICAAWFFHRRLRCRSEKESRRLGTEGRMSRLERGAPCPDHARPGPVAKTDKERPFGRRPAQPLAMRWPAPRCIRRPTSGERGAPQGVDVTRRQAPRARYFVSWTRTEANERNMSAWSAPTACTRCWARSARTRRTAGSRS